MMIWSMLLATIVIGSTCLVASQFNLSRSLGERRHKDAETKGLNLLLDNLTSEQRQQYHEFGYFDVVGSKSGKHYRICHGTSRNVSELLEKNRLGTGRCFMPRGDLVAGDCMLAQKIVLENCEEDALRTALPFLAS